ncbi:hypothetical protein [Bacillus pinisoli]|uniref:hypothetical protein n=1 Tax=Bacillus pinisoli TaxID=2901866 RepID=UPI001FF2130E|nr:hypothetical protein [Bacillus pinisoli]
MFIINLFFYSLCIIIAVRLVNHYQLQKLFISIPYLTVLITLPITFIVFKLFQIELTLPVVIQRFAITIFLFSIGVQIATILNKRYVKRIIYLSVITIISLFLLNLIAIPFPEYLQVIVGPSMFAFNIFMINHVVSLEYRDFLLYWNSIQMFFVFLTTPVFLFLSNKILINRYPDVKDPPILLKENLSIKLTNENIVSMMISIVIVLITMKLPVLNHLFLHDFVFGLITGFSFGLFQKKFFSQHEKVTHLHQMGNLGLYIFIISTINHVAFVHHTLLNLSILLVVIIKTILVAIISFLLIYYAFTTLSHKEKLVASVAGWTFILNAPVVCMHGMRTVVTTYGPAPYMLLIIPPIILWVVNYFHIIVSYLF